MTLYVWPAILMPENQLWSPSSGGARDGGRTLGGGRRMANWSAGGVWRATLQNVAVTTPDEILTAQALDALLNDGSEPIAVPRRPGDQAPGAGVVTYTPFSDQTTFSDDTQFASAAPYGAVTVAAAVYATSITFTWAGDALRGGEDFSVDTPSGPNMYRIARFESIAESGGIYTYTAEIRPPLTTALAVGDSLNLVNPYCTMLLTNAREFSAMLQLNRWGFFNAEFVQA